MTSELHLQSQSTKKYSLPLSHLEYSYIEKCTNTKELEKILRVLKSGEEGRYPDLEKFTEKRLETLDPKSRELRIDGPIPRISDIGSGDRKTIEDDLQKWTNDMQRIDSNKLAKPQKPQGDEIVGDENLPPVRGGNITLEGKKQKRPEQGKKKRAVPRDYRDWDKIDIDAELEKVDCEEKKGSSKKSNLNGMSLEIDSSTMTAQEKEMKANREKDKGNEAFHSHDFEESVIYYSRSLSLMPSAASYNNRALAYIKLEKWDKAITDCNSVLKLEADNIKALLRRGTAFKSKMEFDKANADLKRVLEMEPNNKKAEALIEEISKDVLKKEKERKEKGRRMVIEEVEEDSEDGETESIEVEKPMVNGFRQSHSGKNSEIQNRSSVDDTTTKSKMEEKKANAKTSSIPDKKMTALSGNKREDEEESQVKKESAAFSSSSSSSSSLSSLKASSQGKQMSGDTTQVCSDSALSSSNTTLSSEGQMSSSSSPSLSSLSSHQKLESDSGSSSSAAKVSFSLGDSSTKISQEGSHASAKCSSEIKDSASSESFTRPVLVQLPLPADVQKLKEDGNTLFRSGQYGEALEKYSGGINKLRKETDQSVNLSILLGNRSACFLKTGNCTQAIADCEESLSLVPHNSKALLRRAAAYEGREKYAEAYIDYKHALSIDKTIQQAHQGAGRCQAALQLVHGQKAWREKIPPLRSAQPWEVPLIVDQAGMHKSLSSTVSLAELTGSVNNKSSDGPNNKVTPSVPVKESSTSVLEQPQSSTEKTSANSQDSASKEQMFGATKAKGNNHVQKGEYQEAAACYTSCLALLPDQVACYTNRALCHLKLDMPTEAESDCDKALTLQANNPKALYRRALARKALQQYKLSLQDLVELLKLEPKNSAAKKEMEILKKAYKEELDRLKQKKIVEQDTKVRKRMKIEEVEDEEEEEKPPSRGKAAEKLKSQSKSRANKMTQPPAGGKKSTAADKKPQPSQDSTLGQPVAPPSAPRLMKTTPYEFCQAWNSLKPCQGIQPYAEILRQIAPSDLASVISNKLDGQMLQIIVRCVNEEMVLKGECEQGYQVLDSLCKVPRFSTVSMFMSSKEKKEVAGVLDHLAKSPSTAYSSEDIQRLKREYSVK